ncbi:hypothetical protein ACTSKR_15540 [Chitinibacteraceae bacterium HSL-7]
MSDIQAYVLVTDHGWFLYRQDECHAGSYDELTALAKEIEDTIVAVLADLADEELRHDTVPRLRGRDRQTLWQRKLLTTFRQTPLRSVRAATRHSKGREEEIVLAALPSPDRVMQVADAIRTAGAVLAGIWSLPQLVAQHAIQHAAQGLALYAVPGGGLRQCFVGEEAPRLLRLTCRDQDWHNIDDMLLRQRLVVELGMAREYLVSQRQLDRNAPLGVTLYAPKELAIRLASAIREQDADTGEYRVTALALAPEHGLFRMARDQIRHHRIAQHYASGPMLQSYRVRAALAMVRRSLWGALALSLLFALWAGISGVHNQRETRVLDANTAELEASIRALRAQLPAGADAQAPMWRRMEQLQTDWLLRWPRLIPRLQTLSMTLTDYPGLNLDKVSWRVLGLPDPDHPPDADNASAPAVLTESVVLAGHYASPQAFRAASQQTEALVLVLAQKPRASARILAEPVATAASAEIDKLDAARFSVEMRIRPSGSAP